MLILLNLLAGAAPEDAAQIGAEHAQDAGTYDVRPPHEERHTSQKVKENQHKTLRIHSCCNDPNRMPCESAPGAFMTVVLHIFALL
jgi:hypothetical protein